MENITKQIEDSIEKSTIPIIPGEKVPSPALDASSTASNGYNFLGIHWTIWLVAFIIFVVLFVIGLSFFVAKMKDMQGQFSGLIDLLNMFGKIGSEQKKQEKAEQGIEMVGGNVNSNKYETPVDNSNMNSQNVLGNLLNKPTPFHQPKKSDSYKEDSNVSSIQQKGGKGFCYIGEDKGIRVCAKVEESDKCMSGNIFPTKDMCINPKLR